MRELKQPITQLVFQSIYWKLTFLCQAEQCEMNLGICNVQLIYY